MIPSISVARWSSLTYALIAVLFCTNCAEKKPDKKEATITAVQTHKIKVIFDTDANNELDDQHALAYLLFNGDTFEVPGITVNATYNGGEIQGHFDEAERVLQLSNLKGDIPLLKGANGNYQEISEDFNPEDYDGQDGVDFLIETTKKDAVIIVAVGKLTNIALALKKDPGFAERTKIVWLGSNYPQPGEYNQDNDTIAMNYVLNSSIPFEMVTVRYGDPSGTDAVSVTQDEINQKMPGLGPIAKMPIKGRHGGEFANFGDYSVSLFQHIFDHVEHPGDKKTRPLFDMVAVAILKNSNWGEQKEIPAPILIDNAWVERPDNNRKITLWENFDKEALLTDFYNTMKNPILVSNP
ncbi:nucleoside hydrolase [Muriicola sp. Z0-33]|uniref:nucleoside hydrolase n=1 Tax=Muriicola sp. Z0-33 TaxID=2816957 RepID=UPI00223708CA|nr:nucleoside hydrolase [Muriicola sp. Z0-33]MCW5517790.1 nucleoside hydrolase [Muriicola sp. Z0-33]